MMYGCLGGVCWMIGCVSRAEEREGRQRHPSSAAGLGFRPGRTATLEARVARLRNPPDAEEDTADGPTPKDSRRRHVRDVMDSVRGMNRLAYIEGARPNNDSKEQRGIRKYVMCTILTC